MATTATSDASAFESPAALWLGLWRHGVILGAATLEAAALWIELEPRSDFLDSLSQALDCGMRSAAFLRLMRHGLRGLYVPTYFAIRRSKIRKRVHP